MSAGTISAKQALLYSDDMECDQYKEDTCEDKSTFKCVGKYFSSYSPVQSTATFNRLTTGDQQDKSCNKEMLFWRIQFEQNNTVSGGVDKVVLQVLHT